MCSMLRGSVMLRREPTRRDYLVMFALLPVRIIAVIVGMLYMLAMTPFMCAFVFVFMLPALLNA